MRKIAAHYVFTGTELLKNAVVEISDTGVISNIDCFGENISETASTEFYSGIIIPGFVNTHCHIELSHMKNIIPQHLGMAEFCERIKSKRNTASEAEQIAAIKQADSVMEKEGIVAVGDISNSAVSIQAKKHSKLFYHTFIETLGLENNHEQIFRHNKSLQKYFIDNNLRATITPHAPYSLSEMLFEMSVEDGNQSNIISIHNKESADEIELFKTKGGRMKQLLGNSLDTITNTYNNPSHRILKYAHSSATLLMVHNTYTTQSDLTESNQYNITWVLCPNSNLHIENKLPDVELLYKHTSNIAIGTDSLSSNTSLSILDELKTLSNKFPCIQLHDLLRWATFNGAHALHIDEKYGSIKLGAQPGLLLLSGVDFKTMRLNPQCKIRVL